MIVRYTVATVSCGNTEAFSAQFYCRGLTGSDVSYKLTMFLLICNLDIKSCPYIIGTLTHMVQCFIFSNKLETRVTLTMLIRLY